MIYTAQTKKALKLCFEAHKDQLDKSGMPYVFHPFHLAEQMTDEETTTAALLHDVVEDTDYTFEDLERMGFSAKVLNYTQKVMRFSVRIYLSRSCFQTCRAGKRGSQDRKMLHRAAKVL